MLTAGGDPPATYDEIVAAVRERFPEARTTRRSVASIASTLRHRGVEVRMRRGKPA